MCFPQRFLAPCLLVLGLTGAATAAAQTPATTQWGLGLAIGLERQPYRDFDDSAQVLPLLLVENRWVRAVGTTLDLKLPSPRTVSFAARLRYAGDGYEAEDSPFLQGMAERKGGFWFGGAASWNAGWATVSGELLGDVSGESKGARASLAVERRFTAGNFALTPRVAVHRVDRKYVDYYYGVRADEGTALRPAHLGQAATNVEAGLRIGYSLGRQHQLSLDLATVRLGSGITDSPLVDRKRQDEARIAYLYLF